MTIKLRKNNKNIKKIPIAGIVVVAAVVVVIVIVMMKIWFIQHLRMKD